MTVGERIAILRKSKKMSQTDLAQRVGLASKSSICKMEKDDNAITTDMLTAIAKVLDTTPGFLLGDSEHEDSIKNASLHAKILRDERVLAMIEEFYSLDEMMQETIIDFVHISSQKASSVKIND